MNKLELREAQLLLLEAFKETDRICRKHNIRYFMIGGTLLGAARHKGFIPWDDDMDIAMYREDYDRFLSVCNEEISTRYFMQNYRTDKDCYAALTRICINGTYIQDKYRDHFKCHKGLYVDIFPLDNVSDDRNKRAIQKFLIQLIDQLIFFKSCIVWRKGFLSWKLVGKVVLKYLCAFVTLRSLHIMREKVMRQYSADNTVCVCSTVSKYGFDKQVLARHVYGKPELLEFEDGFYYAPQDWKAYLVHLYGNYDAMPPVEQQVPNLNVYVLDE